MTRPSAAGEFSDYFGRLPDLVVRSPGRVNLIGDHTDYHDGFVLPAAIDRGTDIAVAHRVDGRLRVVSASTGESDEVMVSDLDLGRGPSWSKYVRGCVDVLRTSGVRVAGADMLIGGDLPVAVGLSSSASLEAGVCYALAALTNPARTADWLDADRLALARLGQRVENDIIGVQSGIMDQLAVAFGQADRALLIDCRSLAIEAVGIPSSVRILVIHSGISRSLAGSAYNQRQAESTAALSVIRSSFPEAVALRDVTPTMLAQCRGQLDPVQWRRAHHVVTENERVLDAVRSMRAGDVAAFGRLMSASHASLRDDYDVSLPDLDVLVEIASGTAGVYGARLTGAGFGGCVVTLVDAERVDDAAAAITLRYAERTGRDGVPLPCRASHGVTGFSPDGSTTRAPAAL